MIDTPTVPACRERDIVDALAAQGYAVVANFLAEPTIVALRREAGRHAAAGELAAAGVGRGGARMERADIRGDRVRWLDDDASVPAERALRDALEALRSAINRELTLGLFEFEGHYAHYAPGAHYARHRDRFRDDDARVLSCVLYLNEGWCDENGGALRLYVDPGSHRDVLPVGGTLAIFLSAQFEHEVLPATRSRWSIAGWFRRRAREQREVAPALLVH